MSPVARVHHDDRAALRVVLLDGRPQVRLGLELESPVDREHEVAPRVGGSWTTCRPAGDLLALAPRPRRCAPRACRPASVSYWRSSPVEPDAVDVPRTPGPGRRPVRPGSSAWPPAGTRCPGRCSSASRVARRRHRPAARGRRTSPARSSAARTSFCPQPEDRARSWPASVDGVDDQARVRVDVARLQRDRQRHAACDRAISPRSAGSGSVVHPLRRCRAPRRSPDSRTCSTASLTTMPAIASITATSRATRRWTGGRLTRPSPADPTGREGSPTRSGMTIPSLLAQRSDARRRGQPQPRRSPQRLLLVG